MDFLPAELIRKKKSGQAHTREEIQHLIKNYATDNLPDYQMSAWLMAVCFQGMTAEETLWLTQEMRDSGQIIDWQDVGKTVDKHSTGGIGDKTSLILAPLVAAAGVHVPMMAGRGLAHTGGTLDKLESLSGFNVQLDLTTFKQQVRTVGTAIIGQTKEICPADRKLYALRDVTGTVDSLPLICGSIMSKKLAEGTSALVLDVKYGSGAFMKTLSAAENLGRSLCDIGQACGKKVVALVTRMDEPLGRFVGNALEVHECLEILKGKTAAGPGKDYIDTIALTVELAAHMFVLAERFADLEEARVQAQALIRSGAAYKKFVEMCAAQGANLETALPIAPEQVLISAPSDGFFVYTDIEKIGLACVHLGAGRKFQSDRLDLSTGIENLCHQGQAIKKGDPLFRVYAAHNEQAAQASETLQGSYKIESKPPPRSALIAKVIT